MESSKSYVEHSVKDDADTSETFKIRDILEDENILASDHEGVVLVSFTTRHTEFGHWHLWSGVGDGKFVIESMTRMERDEIKRHGHELSYLKLRAEQILKKYLAE